MAVFARFTAKNAAKKTKGYTAADMKVVSEKHEWTREDFQNARRGRDVLPKSFFDALETRRVRGQQKAPTKVG